MKTHKVAIGTVVWLCLLTGMGCGGDDDTSPAADAGPDGGEQGGSGGTFGHGGSGGASGSSGGTAAGSGGEGGGGNQDGKYEVSGNLSGLAGSGLKLKLNGGSELSPSKNGKFTFDAELDDGADYEVTVSTQPKDPTQTCAVSDGKGTIDKADVTNVKVSCGGEPHTIGGTLTGVAGGTVVIKNGDESLSLTADGKFTFKNKVNSGANYAVTVQTNPSGKTCGVDHGSGTVGSDDVSDVAVGCYADLSVVAMPRPGSVGLTWNSNGASSYSALASTASNCNFDNVSSCENGSQQTNVTSPYVFSGLTNGKVYYIQIRASFPGGLQTHSSTIGVRPNRPQFDDAVNATALGANGVVYVGGNFSYVGAYTGSTVPLDATTGAPTRLPNFPTLNGGVAAIVSDGNNGYFLGGSFNIEVSDTVTLSGLAHVKADGTLDAMWNPNVTGDVNSIALSGTTLYVGGTFTKLGADTRGGLGAVSTTGVGAATPWAPTLMVVGNDSIPVAALAVSGGTLYVGGDFTMVNSTNVGYLAAFDVSTTPGTPTLKTSWNPNATGPNGVRSLLVAGDTVYAAGYFQKIGNDDRIGMAAIDANGAAKAFRPDPDDLVHGMAVVDDKIYVAGEFTQVGGKNRKYVAELATSDGAAVDGWAPEPDKQTYALAVSGDTVYLGGDFTTIGSGATPRSHLAAVDRSNANVKPWDPRPNTLISVINVTGDTVYVSGDDVRTIAPEPRGRLASFNGASLTSWAPNISGGNVHAIAFSGTTLYAGGDFDTIGAAMRQSVAAIDGNGAATAWNAHLSSTNVVDAVLADDNRVYVGGQFQAPSSRSNLAAFNKTDGAVSTNWNPPSPDDYVHALALDGTTLYAGGEFLNLGGTGRSRLVAIDGSGGIVTGWNPGAGANTDEKVNALIVGGDNVFVGGSFTTLGGQPRNRLGAVDKGGTLNGFDPNLSCPDAQSGDPCEVTSLAFASGFLYAGGQFGQVGTGQDVNGRSGTAQWDSSLNLTPWARNVVGSVYGINANGDNSHIYVVGNYFSIANQAASDFFVASNADTE